MTQEAFRLCKMVDLNFIGNVEGHDLFNDRVDVVVCDGFIGNIVLKTLESFAKGPFLVAQGRNHQKSQAHARRPAGQRRLRTIKRRTDPDTRGGAPLLGLNGIVFKAHGSARERAIMNGIGQAVQAVEHHITDIIRSRSRPGQRARRQPPKHESSRKNSKIRAPGIISRAALVPSSAVGSYVPSKVLANAVF